MVVRHLGIFGNMAHMGVAPAIVYSSFFLCQQRQKLFCCNRLGAATDLLNLAFMQRIDWAIPLTNQFFPHKQFEHAVAHKCQSQGAELFWITVRAKQPFHFHHSTKSNSIS